jgi:hypothetical protein
MKFIRTTHDADGQWQPFAPAAWQFWRTHGCSIGEVIRSETALTFTEIAAACQEFALEQQPYGSQLEANEGYVAWCLVQLLEFGMVQAVPAGARLTQPVIVAAVERSCGHDETNRPASELASNRPLAGQPWPRVETAGHLG